MRVLGTYLDIAGVAPGGVVWVCTFSFPVPRAVSKLGIRWPASSVVDLWVNLPASGRAS